MNKHLNIFKTYTDTNRAYQLENDLTRALAICFQEDTLFFHEVLKEILKSTDYYNQLFESLEGETVISIDIQQKTSRIENFEHIFAIALSESEMSDFWKQNHNQHYDPICDLVIKINDVLFVFEAKRDKVNCTAQLYNQIFNIIRVNNVEDEFNEINFKDLVTPFDLNWSKLMAIAVKVSSFEKSMSNQSRFLTDFIRLVKMHNFRWLPESSISSLSPKNKLSIERRIESTIEELTKKRNDIKKLNYSDRMGIEFPLPWAQEVLFNINDDGNLVASIYPGNTKAQGQHLFRSDPKFNPDLTILNEKYKVGLAYHIKFTSCQRYFTGLWFVEKDLKVKLYSSKNFWHYTGRKRRGEQWAQIETLFNESLKYDWKKQCKWQSIINSEKSRFDISFGYEISITIPFEKLKRLDTKQSDLTGLVNLLSEIYDAFINQLIPSTPVKLYALPVETLSCS